MKEKIPEEMMAVRIHGPRDIRYEKVPVPNINEDEVLVKIVASGICAGDVKIYEGAQMFWGGGGQPKWVREPVTLGHEFGGRVVAIGENAKERTGLELGDLAVAEQIIPCQSCEYCLSGEYWMCKNQDIYGFKKDYAEGSMAEYMKFNSKSRIHRIPESIPEKYSAMIEPLSCAVHTVERASIEFSDSVVIAGLGPIGLCKLQLAKLKHPRLLIGVDLIEKRLQLAREYGADYVFNPLKSEVVEEVRKLTGGYGCNIYVHCSGHSEGVLQGLKMLRNRGRYVEFSVYSNDTSVDWSIIGDRKELDILGSHIGGRDGYKIAIEMLEKGLVDVSKIVTHEFNLKDFLKAFNVAKSGQESIKVIMSS
jgi:L-iditol 2-dehydrogenase